MLFATIKIVTHFNFQSLYLQEKVTNEHLVEEQKNIKADNGKWESEINHLTKLNHQLGRELEKYKVIVCLSFSR